MYIYLKESEIEFKLRTKVKLCQNEHISMNKSRNKPSRNKAWKQYVGLLFDNFEILI